MRRRIGAAVVVLVTLAFWSVAEPVKVPTYSSEKPLYARVVLDEKATKTLTLVFDESQGTGRGYDIVYADLNLNGDLTDDEAIKGTPRSQEGSFTTCSFPPIDVPIAYKEEANEGEKPWQITLAYSQYERRRLLGLLKTTNRLFTLTARLKLVNEGQEWEYSFRSLLHPVEDPAAAKPIAFGGKPSLAVETKPDPRKKGNTGIAATLTAGAGNARCSKGDQPIMARVRVTNEQGKIVHTEDVGLDKLFFG